MRRVLIVAAVAASSLLIGGGVAQAQTPPDGDLPPAFAPPVVAPVVDVDSAADFAENFATDNAGDFLGENGRRVRVLDANATCLEHPAVADQFGCIFTLQAAVIQRDRHRGHSSRRHHSRHVTRHVRGHSGHHPQPQPRRVRVRFFGCIGALRITGGPTVTPTAEVSFSDCVRIRRSDIMVPEPEPVAPPAT